MSYVTNVILACACGEDVQYILDGVNQYFNQENTKQKGIVYMDDPDLPRGWYGGPKRLEAEMFIGAFNYLGLDAFIEHVRRVTFKYPESVQIIVKDEDDSLFRIINLFDTLEE